MQMSSTAGGDPSSDQTATPPSILRHLPSVPTKPSPPRFLLWDKRRRRGWFSGFYCGCTSGGGIGRRGRPSRRGRGAQAGRTREEGAGDTLLSDLQFPRHLTEGAGQTKGEGRPVVPDGALEGGKEWLGDPRKWSPVPKPRPGWRSAPRAPGCGSARACRCAGSAGLRAGRARSSTRRSRRRCGRQGTEGRTCRTDLRRTGAVSARPTGFPGPSGGSRRELGGGRREGQRSRARGEAGRYEVRILGRVWGIRGRREG